MNYMTSSGGLYPSALPLAARLGRYPSWAEYMAEFGHSLYIPEQRLVQDHSYSNNRGRIDDSLPIYYEAGPSYENDEDGWIEVKPKHNFTSGGKRRFKKKSKKAEKKEKEMEQQQNFFAKTVSFSGNADLLDA
jgi:hypothetical protein